jgi:hypothetical protein
MHAGWNAEGTPPRLQQSAIMVSVPLTMAVSGGFPGYFTGIPALKPLFTISP